MDAYSKAVAEWGAGITGGVGIDYNEYPTIKEWLEHKAYQLGGDYRARGQEWWARYRGEQ